MNNSFYAEGLRWSCTRCSCCCRHESGHVFLSKNDLAYLVRETALPEETFIQMYCRWVPVSAGAEWLSLKETSNKDCCFWRDGCSVYHARPTQCRTYPFWKNHLTSKEAWEKTAAHCPGAGTGTVYSCEYIDGCIALEEKETPVGRSRGGADNV